MLHEPSVTVAANALPSIEIATDPASSVVAPLVTFNVIPVLVFIESPLETLSDELRAGNAGTFTVPAKYLPGIPS